jgi:UDP-N-acetylmuramoyl-L-alanyl-D-glutamate--2,6-diaminopimelate ligase
MKPEPNIRTFETLLSGIDTLETAGDLSCEITSVEYDSRRVKPGALFVALPGSKVDGSVYIEEAARRGAVAAVSESPSVYGAHFPYAQVSCARLVLARLAGAFYEYPAEKLCTVGITGTNGKTTVSFMLRDIFKAAGKRPGLIGTVRYEIGGRVLPASRTTPESPDIHFLFNQMIRSGCDSSIMEVSSHALDQYRVAGIQFDVGVFTNLTQDHLDYHGTLEEYFAVKARLFGQVRGSAVINIDDTRGKRLIAEGRFGANVVSYGFEECALVRGIHPQSDRSGSRMRVESPWGSTDISLQLIGRFNLYNALAAFAAAASIGIPLEIIVKALAEIECIPGRLESVGKKNKRVYVDYAHTDDALRNVLRALRPITKGRLVVVFGCGGNRDTGKRRLMGEVASRMADYSIITNDNPRNEIPQKIAAEIAAGFDSERKYEICLDRIEAIGRGIKLIGKNDVLLVAGKGHETVQEIDGAIFPFDDRETVRDILKI